MTLRDTFIAEFDHEMAVTRRVLERVPEQTFDWKPHEKSFSLGGLATHLTELPRWGLSIMRQEFYDLSTATGHAPAKASRADVLEAFDRHVTEFRQAVVGAIDAELAATWTLKRGSHTVLSMPRLSALRKFLVHHMIHHRGQMTVYLRLQGVALPPIYGPSADERM